MMLAPVKVVGTITIIMFDVHMAIKSKKYKQRTDKD